MSKIITIRYDNDPPKMETIKVSKFPLVIFTDPHTNIQNIVKLQEKYKDCQIICLGDITFLYNKEGEYNQKSIQYFIDHRIPCLKGNHDDWVVAQFLHDWNIELHQIEFLKKLPIGFKIVLPDSSHYLCFHNSPKDLWGFKDKIKEREILSEYPIENNTKGIIIGHHHYHFKKDFKIPFIGVGRLSKDGDYALLTENGVEFKKI